MCGICGIYFFDRNKKISRNVIQNMNEALKLRGPDDEGIFSVDRVFFGAKRLAIIDIEKGKQPVFNENKTICAILNGELYNYKEIKKDKLRGRHYLRSNSDTEIIPHMYEELGEKFINEINGMFGIAIWDKKKETLFVYRDRLGIKPIYYYYDKDKFLWASEIKAILASNLIKKEIDIEAVDLFFRLGYVPGPLSIFKNIRKLLPGHYLKIKNDQIKIISYWDVFKIPKKNHTVKFFELVEELNELVEKSVEYRLISDVPLGAFLSGGIDSSFIVSVMKNKMNRPVETFSIKFEDEKLDESYFSNYVSKNLKTKHFEFKVRIDHQEVVSSILPYFDEPFADKSLIPAYYLSKMAKERVKVALSGDGGDELFGGYLKYRTLKAASIYRKINSRMPFSPKILSKIPGKLGKRIKNSIQYGSMGSKNAFIALSEILTNDQKNRIFSEDYKKLFAKDRNPFELFTDCHNECNRSIDEEINLWLQNDIRTYLVDDVLTKVDRTSMCNSLEVRVPILDHKIVEYAVSLPAHLKLNGFNGKYLLKEASKSNLPANIIKRPKHAWNVPMHSWLKNELRECLHEEVFLYNGGFKTMFNFGEIKKILLEHDNLDVNHSNILWNLLVFFIWLRLWY